MTQMRTTRASGLQTMIRMMLDKLEGPRVACGLPLEGIHPYVLTGRLPCLLTSLKVATTIYLRGRNITFVQS